MPNVSDFNGVQYSSRVAQANATQQNISHQQALQAKFTNDAKAGPQGTYDPNTRTMVGGDPHLAAVLRQEAGQVAPPKQGGYVDQFGNPTPTGILNQAQQTDGQTTYNTQTGVVTQGGVIGADAAQRLIASGMTPEQAQKQIQSQQLAIQSTMSNTGQGSSFDPTTGQVIPGSGRLPSPAGGAAAAEKAVRDKYSQLVNGGNSINPADVERDVQVAKQNALKQAELDQKNQDAQKQKEQVNLGGSSKTGTQPATTDGAGQTQPKSSDANTTVSQLVGMLPPGHEAVGAAIQNAYNTAGESATSAQKLEDQRISSANNVHDAATLKLQASLDRTNSQFKTVSDLLQNQLDSQSKLIAQQQTNADNNLAFQQMQQTRQKTQELQQNMDSMRASLALNGITASSNANEYMIKTRQAGEQAISDLQTEFGFKRADLVATFTDLTVKAHQAYVDAFQKELDHYDTAIGSVENAVVNNDQKQADALDKAAADFYTQTDAAKNKQADVLLKGIDSIQTAINQSRDDKRAQEQNAYQRIQWAVQTYGSNVPDSYIQSISKDLPGVDVQGLMNTATLAERNGKKTGAGTSGGGSSYGFSVNEKNAQGNPTFEQYRSQKIAALNSGPHGTGPVIATKEQETQWKNEFDAKESAQNMTSNAYVSQQFENMLAAKTAPAKEKDAMRREFKSRLDSGNTDGALAYASSLGKPLSDAERTEYSQLALAMQTLPKLQAVFRTMAANGETGPIMGKLTRANGWNDNVKSLDAVLNTLASPYERGVLSGKGRIAFEELQRVKATLVNENMTPSQGINNLNLANETVNASLQNKLALDLANKKDIYQTKKYIEGVRAAVPSPTSPEALNASSNPEADFVHFLLQK